VGRDPGEVLRTTTVLVQLAGGAGRTSGDGDQGSVVALQGSPEEIAAGLRAYARHGIGHLQLVLDPITAESIESLAPVLALLDAGHG
jgi:alkanesulfonate monooxygenase SsuD/methylene tetrahydromethanopterin reductase-like flavin-dependent oxidoreductase (luciferase family)